jgi:hypothetical protein
VTDVRWQLIAYVFVSIILWMVAAQLTRRRTGISWMRSLGKGWVASILRFVYYVGIPYAALILGVVPGRYLGLVGPDWLQAGTSPLSGFEAAPNIWHFLAQVRDFVSLAVLNWLPHVGTVAGLAVVMFLLLSVTWLAYSYFRYAATSGPTARLQSLSRGKTPSVMQIVYQAIHWSFYRSAVWLLTGDLYLGVIGGILLVGAEWMLDPGWIDGVHHELSGDELLVDASVLIATSVIFFFVPNLWLVMPIHWLLATASRRMVARGQLRTAVIPQTR